MFSFRKLHPNVIALGFVSFFTDVAADLVTPLLPYLLTAVLAAGPLALGLMEGVADATAAFFKLYAGRQSDRTRRKPWVLAGYAISTASRPLYALVTAGWGVIVIRALDRVGKGIRSSPRDALIADVTAKADLGLAFGFHRALDNAGAVVGGLAAALALTLWPNHVQQVILFSVLPGVLALVVLGVFVKEDARPVAVSAAPDAPAAPRSWRMPPSTGLPRYLGAIGLYAFARLPESFLVLIGLERGFTIVQMLLVWAAYSGVKAVVSYWGGGVADRVGLPRMLLAGWLGSAVVFYAFCIVAGPEAPGLTLALIFVYGIVMSLFEGAEPALVAVLAPPEIKGTAFGWYHLVKGLTAIPAGFAVGWLWQSHGASAAFSFIAAVAAVAALHFFFFVRPSLNALTKPLTS